MIWGCFVSNKLVPIVFVNKLINLDIYMMLNNNLLPYLDALIEDGAKIA